MILLAAEKGWTASLIREVVRCDENTVRLWLKRSIAEGIEGLKDEPRPRITPKVTPAYEEQLVAAVRVRPRNLDLSFSTRMVQCLAD